MKGRFCSLLKIKDKSGRVKFVWRDCDEEPVSIDELILEEAKKKEEEEDEESRRRTRKKS